jgi:hypothetical protein
MNCENLAKIYVAENKIVNQISVASVIGKTPPKMGGRSRNVVENKCRKNVHFSPLHDVDEKERVKPFSPRC